MTLQVQPDNEIMTAEGSGITNREWISDSGASHHLCTDLKSFNDLRKPEEDILVRRVGGQILVTQSRSVVMEVDGEKGKEFIQLHDVLYLPRLSVNLLSIKS